jgi:hypothetical protein
LVDRNATRDYLDVAALSCHIGLTRSASALERLNELYAEFKNEAGDLLHARLCDILRGNRPRLVAEVMRPDGSSKLIFENK